MGNTVLFERDGRVGRLWLNRPEVMNAINDEMPLDLAAAVERANDDPGVHVIVLAGKGAAFSAGYDLTFYAEGNGAGEITQRMPWDPMKDYKLMMRNTEAFMSLWRSYKPVLCKVHGYAVAGGSDIALCSDIVFIEETAKIGYMPARVWGCPTTAMWVFRLGAEKAKRMLFTGDTVSGREAEALGLAYKAVPTAELDDAVEAMADRIASVPQNQLMMQKLMINHAIEAMGMRSTQSLATLFDGITRHSPEGIHFKQRAEEVGWKQAVRERDQGTFDWTRNEPIKKGE